PRQSVHPVIVSPDFRIEKPPEFRRTITHSLDAAFRIRPAGVNQLRGIVHFQVASGANHATPTHAGSRCRSRTRFQAAADLKVVAMLSPPDFIRVRTSIRSSIADSMLSPFV